MNVSELMPLGTVVLLKENLAKLMIVGRGVTYMNESISKESFADYAGIIYPMGVSINPNYTTFFNHDDIDKVIFKGFSDKEDGQFLSMYQDWRNESSINSNRDLENSICD